MLTDYGSADMVKVFISYSHDDKEYFDQIKKSLAQLEQCGKSIDVWADHEIKAGEEWDESIEEKLRQADIILFLVSINFIASSYIKDKELAVGFERREGGSAEVIPVLLSASMWEQTGLARFQALPIDPSDKRSKPIEDWNNKSQAYNSIAREIDDRASDILKNRQVREKNEKLQCYKKKCQEFLSLSPDLKLSIANQHSLNDLCEDLGIGKAEAEKAFEEAEKPFRVLKKNRERYLDTVKAYLSVGSDLSAVQTQQELKDRQLALKLEDRDISALQPEIDRLAEEQRAKEEEDRRIREDEAKRKADAERLAEEQRAKEEAERKAREEEAKRRADAEAERLAALQRAKEEAERRVREDEAKRKADAERLAEEQRAKEEEERKAREEEAKRKADAERLAEEQLAKEEEERKAREEEAKRRAEAERLAEEQRAKEEAERKAREEEAKRKAEADRLAEEQRAKEEAERRVREEEARRGPTLIQISTDRGALVRVGNEWQQKTERITVSGYEQELAKGLAITMVQIPAGSFQMGSPDTEAGRASDEGPQHRVQLQSFFLGQTPSHPG
jgi:formylglycine-generating enzyme required for sulfatase activity